MLRTELIERLEAEYLPRLRSLEARMRARFPSLRFAVTSTAEGGATKFNGHGIGLECLLPDRPADRSDNVALMIDVCHLDENPRLMADICWGHPSGFVEDSLDSDWTSNEQWPAADEHTLGRLQDAFPRLARAFETAVERGEPTPQ